MAAALLAVAGLAHGQGGNARPEVHVIYMGGNDCPPCVAWRRTEFPKLERTAVFKTIRFTFADKLIRSGVPPAFLMPADAKPFKDKLDKASAGTTGSPHVALFVNGEIYDYYFGVRSAEDFEQMLLAAQGSGRYPFKRCLQLDAKRKCAESV